MKESFKEEPCTVQKAEYGKIIVRETRGGHAELIDDTPHHRTYTRFHPSGTYISIKDLGKYFLKVVNDKISFIWGSYKSWIKKNFVQTIWGYRKVETRQNEYINTYKNRNIRVGGDNNNTINGNLSFHVMGFEAHLNYKSKGEEIYWNNYQEIHKNNKRKVDMNEEIYVNQNQTVGIRQNKKENVKQDFHETVGKNYHIYVGQNEETQVGQNFLLKVGQQVAIDAPMIYLNCGKASGVSTNDPVDIPEPKHPEMNIASDNPQESPGPTEPNKEYLHDTYDYWSGGE